MTQMKVLGYANRTWLSYVATLQAPDCTTAQHIACAGLDEAPANDTWFCEKHKNKPSLKRARSAAKKGATPPVQAQPARKTGRIPGTEVPMSAVTHISVVRSATLVGARRELESGTPRHLASFSSSCENMRIQSVRMSPRCNIRRFALSFCHPHLWSYNGSVTSPSARLFIYLGDARRKNSSSGSN